MFLVCAVHPKQKEIAAEKKEITLIQTAKLPTVKLTPPVREQVSGSAKKRPASVGIKAPDDRPHFKPAAIERSIRPVDSVIQIRTDTLKLSVPIADVKMQKQKRKIFQKDFDGFTPRIDSSFHKTASNGLQFKWRSGEEKLTNSEEPKMRLTQKF